MGFAGIQLLNSNQKEKANVYFNKIISRNKSTLNSPELARAYYFKGDYINAQKQYEHLLDSDQNNIEYHVNLAICYYNNGHSEEAKIAIEKLNNLRTDYKFGAVDYGWSQYYAALGEKDLAIRFLLKAVAQGYNYTPSTFQNDPHFIVIKESPEFTNRIMNYWKNKTL
jgi:tetratricopeptide (TPR) repeat protein